MLKLKLKLITFLLLIIFPIQYLFCQLAISNTTKTSVTNKSITTVTNTFKKKVEEGNSYQTEQSLSKEKIFKSLRQKQQIAEMASFHPKKWYWALMLSLFIKPGLGEMYARPGGDWFSYINWTIDSYFWVSLSVIFFNNKTLYDYKGNEPIYIDDFVYSDTPPTSMLLSLSMLFTRLASAIVAPVKAYNSISSDVNIPSSRKLKSWSKLFLVSGLFDFANGLVFNFIGNGKYKQYLSIEDTNNQLIDARVQTMTLDAYRNTFYTFGLIQLGLSGICYLFSNKKYVTQSDYLNKKRFDFVLNTDIIHKRNSIEMNYKF